MVGEFEEQGLAVWNFFQRNNFNSFYISRPRKGQKRLPRTPILRRKNPQTPRKKFLSNVEIFISEVKIPFFRPKKEEKTRLFRALSSLLVQIYNIFRRNPNRLNISQHSLRLQFAAICSRRGLACVILRGALCEGSYSSVR